MGMWRSEICNSETNESYKPGVHDQNLPHQDTRVFWPVKGAAVAVALRVVSC